jgi:hypothetical protein
MDTIYLSKKQFDSVKVVENYPNKNVIIGLIDG